VLVASLAVGFSTSSPVARAVRMSVFCVVTGPPTVVVVVGVVGVASAVATAA
jgi:hypothetical protein